MKRISYVFAVTLFLIAGAIFIACGGAGTTGSSSGSYQGPGSDYTITFSPLPPATPRTFSLNEATASLSIGGTVEVMDSGLYKLTVTRSNTPTSVAVNSEAYAMSIPGVVTLIKPILSGSTQIITAVSTGTCPTSSFTGNWIQMNVPASHNVYTNDMYGTFNFAADTGIGTVATKYAFNAPTTDLGSSAIGTGTCSAGVMTVGTAKMYLTQVGGAIVNTNTTTASDASFIFAMPRASLTSHTAFTGDYIGMIFDARSNSVTMVSVSGVAGVYTFYQFTDLDTNTVSAVASGTMTLSGNSVNSPSEGFMIGTVSTASGSGSVACMGHEDVVSSGKKFIMCSGTAPGSSNTSLFNMLLISK